MGKNIKIFIASSGEVKDEREKCVSVLLSLRKAHAHLDLEPVLWEFDVVPGNNPEHNNNQDRINTELKESDFAVFIFYSKIGQYTREEFDYSNAEKKKLFAYFKTGFSPDKKTLKSWEELLDFKDSLGESVLSKKYKELEEFEKILYENLNHFLAEEYPVTAVAVSSTSTDTVDAIVNLSRANLELIQTLNAKDQEIKLLKAEQKKSPENDLQLQLQKLIQEKEAITSELNKSEEIRKQQAKDKEDLEVQLSLQKNTQELKAQALEAVKKGNYDEAEKYLKTSAKESIVETASTFYELGKIKKLQLLYTDAFNYYELAVKVDSTNSLYLNDAGVMASDLGYYNKAIGYMEKSLEIEIREYGYEHPSVSTRYNNLGYFYDNMGLPDKGIEYFEKSLAIDRKFYGEDHPIIAVRYNNLGSAYDNKNDYDKAIEYNEKALLIDLNYYGDKHENIAISYNNLGSAYNNRGEYDKSIEYYEKALVIDRIHYGEDHPNIALRYSNLGTAYNNKNEYDKAIEYTEKSLVIGRKLHGEEHPDIAIRYLNLGWAYYQKEDFNKAVEYYNRSLTIFLQFFPEDHINVKSAKDHLIMAQKSLKSLKKK